MNIPSFKTISYRYEGIDQSGQRVKGKLRALSPAIVKVELQRQGIQLLNLRQANRFFQSQPKKIKSKEIMTFTQHLATLLNAGFPLTQALQTIGQGHENPSMETLITSLSNEIAQGKTLSTALRQHPRYFNEIYCNLIHAGEQTGTLDVMLKRLISYQEKTYRIKSKLKKTLLYPIAVLIVAFLVALLLLLYVVPQFEAMFQSFGAELPAFTRFVIQFSRFLKHMGLQILAVIVIGAAIFTQARKKSARLSYAWDNMKLKLFISGPLLRKII